MPYTQWGGTDVNGGVAPANTACVTDAALGKQVLALTAHGDLYNGTGPKGVLKDGTPRPANQEFRGWTYGTYNRAHPCDGYCDVRRVGAAIQSKQTFKGGHVQLHMKPCKCVAPPPCPRPVVVPAPHARPRAGSSASSARCGCSSTKRCGCAPVRRPCAPLRAPARPCAPLRAARRAGWLGADPRAARATTPAQHYCTAGPAEPCPVDYQKQCCGGAPCTQANDVCEGTWIENLEIDIELPTSDTDVQPRAIDPNFITFINGRFSTYTALPSGPHIPCGSTTPCSAQDYVWLGNPQNDGKYHMYDIYWDPVNYNVTFAVDGELPARAVLLVALATSALTLGRRCCCGRRGQGDGAGRQQGADGGADVAGRVDPQQLGRLARLRHLRQ